MFGFKKIVAVTGVAAMMAVGGGLANDAQAATVTFENGANGGGDDRFTVSCSLSCEGWLFDLEELGGDIGGLIDFQDSSYATGQGENWEEDLLAFVAGENGLAFSKTEENPSTSYFSDAFVQLFKIGQTPNVGVLVNTAGFSQAYTFASVATGSGLSHIASYGTVPPIPLPAAGWLLLTAVGGLGFAAHRRRRKAA